LNNERAERRHAFEYKKETVKKDLLVSQNKSHRDLVSDEIKVLKTIGMVKKPSLDIYFKKSTSAHNDPFQTFNNGKLDFNKFTANTNSNVNPYNKLGNDAKIYSKDESKYNMDFVKNLGPRDKKMLPDKIK